MFLILNYINVFNIIIFIFSVIFFYLFIGSKEKYIGYWSLSWLLYGIGITIEAILIQQTPLPQIIVLQQMTFLASTILLFYGVNAFINKHLHWIWFTSLVCALIWLIASSSFHFSYHVTVMPIAILSSAITVYAGIMFLNYWPIEGREKLITGIMIIAWGIHKSYYIYLNPNFVYTQYLIELILFIILSISMVLLCLQKKQHTLIKDEKIFRLLTENSPNIIYLYTNNPSPKYDYISPNVTNILGYSQEDFYSDPNFLYKIVHPEDKSLLDLSSSPNLDPNSSIAVRYKSKDGPYFWFEEYATHIYDSNGQLFGIEGSLRDITSTKKFSDQVKVNEKERQKLLYSISHELKTPLTAIRGNIEAIRDKKIPPGENSDKYLSNAYNKTRILERLVNDLFELSQLESNQFSFNFSVVKFREFFPEVFEKISQDVISKDLEFRLSIDPDLYKSQSDFLIDIERIEQVLYNIINNAIKNTLKGGYVSVSCVPSGRDYIIIHISDSGQGIPKDVIPHIFDMFYKGPNANIQGSGLGLAITKEILLKHNATIHVNSELNVGTTFTIHYPILKE